MCVFAVVTLVFCFRDLDLEPITLIYEFDLYIEVYRSKLSKVRARTGRTHRQTDTTERITTTAFASSNNATNCFHKYCNIIAARLHAVPSDCKAERTIGSNLG